MSRCCDNCVNYQWYYDWCEKWKCEKDGRSVCDEWKGADDEQVHRCRVAY